MKYDLEARVEQLKKKLDTHLESEKKSMGPLRFELRIPAV
jgi:hypothetical protein